MACLRVRGSADAAQAAKAHPVFRPHCGLPQRARNVKSAAPRDLNGYGPKVRLKVRRLSVCSSVLCSVLSVVGAGWLAWFVVVTEGGVVMPGIGGATDAVVGD
eukprot:122542-Pleurochrysis_carterae.AAC.1